MHIHLLFNGLTQVLDEVETVCDLQGLRCALTCSLRICATTISTDDFNLRVLPQPARAAFNAPIRKDINYGLPLEIDDDGSVSLRLAPAPIVDANNRWWRGGAFRTLLKVPQHRIIADTDAQTTQEPFGRPPTSGVPEMTDNVTSSRSST